MKVIIYILVFLGVLFSKGVSSQTYITINNNVMTWDYVIYDFGGTIISSGTLPTGVTNLTCVPGVPVSICFTASGCTPLGVQFCAPLSATNVSCTVPQCGSGCPMNSLLVTTGAITGTNPPVSCIQQAFWTVTLN